MRELCMRGCGCAGLTVVFELPVASSAHGQFVLPDGQIELVELVAEQQPLSWIRRGCHTRTIDSLGIANSIRLSIGMTGRSSQAATDGETELGRQQCQYDQQMQLEREKHD